MKKNLTELVFILDRSGSMGGLEQDTIGGFNAMLEKQKALDGQCRITTVLFDNRYELLHDRTDIRAVRPITAKEYHVGGSTALLDAVNEKSNITVVISDNLTTGMTGGQDSAGTGRLEQICAGLGVEPEHIRVVVPLPKNMEEIRRTIREEIEYKGVSVIIPRRECIQTAKRHNAKKQ